MMRSQRTTGCHGLSPIHDTAMRAMMSTVNAVSTKPMMLTEGRLDHRAAACSIAPGGSSGARFSSRVMVLRQTR